METVTAPIEVTDLEKQVLKNIIGSEYQDCDPTDYRYMTTHAVYSFSVTNSSKILAGALGSLIKKGLAENCGMYEGDETCCITESGLNAIGITL